MTQDVWYFQEKLRKGLTASLRLSLTSDIRLEPTHASIFNYPMNKVHLTIFGGSGRFLVKGSDDDIAMVTATKSSTRVQDLALHPFINISIAWYMNTMLVLFKLSLSLWIMDDSQLRRVLGKISFTKNLSLLKMGKIVKFGGEIL